MKRILFLTVFFCVNFAWGQSVGRDHGSTYSTDSGNRGVRYLGDPFPKYNFFTNGGWDNAAKVQIGYGTSSGSMTWVNADWEGDYSANRLVKKDTGFGTFTSIGNWYFVGRYSYNLTDYAYNDETGWTSNQTLDIPGNATYYTVMVLGNPTSFSATASTTTQINLLWSKWNSRDVIILRNTSGTFTDPTQGSSYSVGNTIGDATVVYKGNLTSFSNTGLNKNTTYYYKIYSENYNYYSDGTMVNATTLSDIFKAKQTGNWSDYTTWQISGDNGSNYINASSGDIPTAANAVNLVDNYTLTVNANAAAKSITISNGSINVTSGNTLTITDALTNNGGTISFENNASLVQVNNVANTGNIIYNRTSTNMNQYDYTYWSSPVAGEFLDAITNTDKLYDFNSNTNNWNHLNLGGTPVASTLSMVVGKGYAARNPMAGPITQVGTFTGVPNNGDIDVTNIAGATNNSVLLGNPYPSALDLELFHTGTNATNLGSTYYFWTHSTVYNGTTYSGSDYAYYNTALNSSVLGGTQYVVASQGFFVDKSNANTITVEFRNSHRASGNNSGFFRMAQNQSNSSTTIASDKIWFNLINPAQNVLKQTLLAYAETASNGYDSIDALTYDGQPALDFYTLIPSYKFVIQARAWEFTDTDVVNIGYRTATAGTFQLVIDHFDPIWNTRSIVLKDNLLNTYHNIKASTYTFTSEAGTFDNRFEIIYQNNALENPDVSFDNAVIVFAKDKNIYINSGTETIKEVTVYDLQGRSIATKTNINTTETSLENTNVQAQVLLVKVTSTEGKITTKKIVF